MILLMKVLMYLGIFITGAAFCIIYGIFITWVRNMIKKVK